MTCPCSYVCRPWAGSPQPPSKEWEHDPRSSKKLGAGATGMAQAFVIGGDVILACGEKLTVMAEFGIVMICYVTAIKMPLKVNIILDV
jgi:hypothetical protein